MAVEAPLKGDFYSIEPRFRIGPLKIGGRLGKRMEQDLHNATATDITLVEEYDELYGAAGVMAKILGPGIVMIAHFAGATYRPKEGRIVVGSDINRDRQLRGRLRWISS